MSDELNFKVKFLEQKVQVMQNEVSQVLGEMQSTIQAIAATYSTALKVMIQRIDALEASSKVSAPGSEESVGTTAERDTDNGKEL